MKFCRVVLIMTLGMTAEVMLQAQMLSADRMLPADSTSEGTVLVASDALPAGLFPDLLAASGHDALLQGLGIAPEIAQAAPKPPPETPKPLTMQDRLTLLWTDTYASPGAFAGLAAGALADQIRNVPVKWNDDGNAYTRRFASEYGQLAARNVIHEGLAAATGLDPRYPVCKCEGVLHRSAHALQMTFTTYRKDGRLTLDMPQIAGAYGSGMVSTYWYPHRLYSPLGAGSSVRPRADGRSLCGKPDPGVRSQHQTSPSFACLDRSRQIPPRQRLTPTARGKTWAPLPYPGFSRKDMIYHPCSISTKDTAEVL